MEEFEFAFYDLQDEAKKLNDEVKEVQGLKKLADDAEVTRKATLATELADAIAAKPALLDALYTTRAAWEETRLYAKDKNGAVDPETEIQAREAFDTAKSAYEEAVGKLTELAETDARERALGEDLDTIK